jgi:hypothetical protein
MPSERALVYGLHCKRLHADGTTTKQNTKEECMNTRRFLHIALAGVLGAATWAQAGAWCRDSETMEQERGCCDSRDSRGGAGMFTAQISWLNTEPLQKLNRLADDLNKDFDFTNNALPVLGMAGYYDIGNGLRTGGGIWAGYKSFQSETYTGLSPTDSTRLDSAAMLRVVPAWVGFNLEKTIGLPGVDLALGGMLGGGTYMAHRQFYEVDGGDFFVSVEDDSLTEEEFEEDYGAFAFAPFVAWDLHGGATFKLARVFSLGIDGVLMFTYAPEGFGFGFGDFLTVNPGIRMRFIFGTSA